MTDRVRTSISKVSVTLGLIITIVTLIAGGVRIVDLTSQTASTVAILSDRIEDEQDERITQDGILKDAIVAEREERKADNTKQLVKLAEIDPWNAYDIAEVQAYAAAHPEMEVVLDEQQHIYIPKELGI